MQTLEQNLQNPDANVFTDALRKLVKLELMIVPTKKEITQTSSTSVTLNPPALIVQGARVTAGDATAGAYIPLDSGGTPAVISGAAPGKFTVSDDGTTLTFPTALTGVTVVYMARSYTPLATQSALGGP